MKNPKVLVLRAAGTNCELETANAFKAVGVFYIIPVVLLFFFFQKHLMNIYGGGTKG